jgi:guanyl-specific ribonuclease Sa
MKFIVQPLCFLGIFLIAAVFPGSPLSNGSLQAASCEFVVQELSGKLPVKIDVAELIDVLRTLNQSGNRQLPAKFVTKQEAKAAGWRPGQNLWASGELRGKSLGGDRFGNYEKKLPDGRRKWREADLDYQGGHRGPKRLIFSTDGLRMVTVDHYQTFKEVPACR